jgi:hypothetical protein
VPAQPQRRSGGAVSAWSTAGVTAQAFVGLYSLRTQISVETARACLAWLPAVRELARDVVSNDVAGEMLRVVAQTLPEQCMRDIAFHRRFSLKAARDLPVLARLTKLVKLEIRNMLDAALSPDYISGSVWKAFVSAGPTVERPVLPSMLRSL